MSRGLTNLTCYNKGKVHQLYKFCVLRQRPIGFNGGTGRIYRWEGTVPSYSLSKVNSRRWSELVVFTFKAASLVAPFFNKLNVKSNGILESETEF